MGGCGGQPCPSAVPGHVCAACPGGGSGFFFLPLSFSPFFTSPPKYSASLSSGGGGGGSAWLLGGAGALLCTLWVLLGAGRVSRGAGMLRLPMLAALVSALAWEVSAEAARTTSLPPRGLPGLGPAPPGPCGGGRHDPGWTGAPAGGLCLVSHRFSPFRDHFVSPMATLPGTCPGKGAGSLRTPRTLQGVALTPSQPKGLAQEEALQTPRWCFICLLSPPDRTLFSVWSLGSPFSSGIWGGDAQECLFWVTEELI